MPSVDGMRDGPRRSTSFMLLEAIGGRARTEPDGGAAFGQREARWNVAALAVWEDPAQDDEQIAWVRRTVDTLAARVAERRRLRQLRPGRRDRRTRAGRVRPERYARLARVKRRYDPDNVFRFNHNIEPAADEA